MTAMYGQEVYEISERDRIVAEVEAKLAEINRWIEGQDYSAEVMAALKAKYRERTPEDMAALAQALIGTQGRRDYAYEETARRQQQQAMGVPGSGSMFGGIGGAAGTNIRQLFG